MEEAIIRRRAANLMASSLLHARLAASSNSVKPDNERKDREGHVQEHEADECDSQLRVPSDGASSMRVEEEKRQHHPHGDGKGGAITISDGAIHAAGARIQGCGD